MFTKRIISRLLRTSNPLLHQSKASFGLATTPSSSGLSAFHSPIINKYGGYFYVAMLPGDGLGPEMCDHVEAVFDALNAPVKFERVELNSEHSTAKDLDNALLACKRHGVTLKGNMETKFDVPGFRSLNRAIRNHLDLFANVVRCRTHPGVTTGGRHGNIDIVVIRENTEGEYSNLEHQNVKGVVEMLKVITRPACERIARFGFEYALAFGRKKVSAIHKANIMKLSDGLFLEVCREVSKDYPQLQFDDFIIDNCCMQLVSRPGQFDVMLLPNLYGNIVTNVAAGLCGGAGLPAGRNLGKEYAIFECGTRSSGKSLIGKDCGNPTAFLSAAADLLEYLGETDRAKIMSESISRALLDPDLHTPDIGGTATTSQVVAYIVRECRKLKKEDAYLE